MTRVDHHVLSTWRQLLAPFSRDLNDMLLWASLPTLGALVCLFLLREHDTLWNVG